MHNSPSFAFDESHFYENGRPAYFASAEVPYFRIPKAEWRRRIELLLATGAHTLSTYIPWLVHEPQEGNYIIDAGDGCTDLGDFLRTAQELGCSVIVRPGPYIYSELMQDGLPAWLLRDYPEILAQKADGTPFRPWTVSYLHPLFLEKAERYYRWICKYLAPFTASNGGPVTLFQLDNETGGVQIWFGSLDHHPAALQLHQKNGRYASWLLKRYHSLDAINDAYQTHFPSIESLAPREHLAEGLAKLRQEKDFCDFTCECYAEYLSILAKIARECGIDTPFTHNAGDIHLNAMMREAKQRFGNELLLGCDHYWTLNQSWAQNNPTPQKIIEYFLSTEMLRIHGNPPNIQEFQYGTPSDWPTCTPEALSVCLYAHLAFGLQGHNGYIFTGGPNPPNAGWSSTVYDYGAPVAYDGAIRPTYGVIRDFGAFVQRHPEIIQSRPSTAVRILMCWEAFRFGAQEAPIPNRTEGKEVLQEFLTKGILTCCFTSGTMPQICDPEGNEWDMDFSTPLIVLSGGVMAARLQRRLVEYIQNGGKVMLCGIVPLLDEDFFPCAFLADAFGTSSGTRYPNDYGTIDYGDKDRPSLTGPLYPAQNLPPDAQIIARGTFSGGIAAWVIRRGKGMLLVNGAMLRRDSASHAEWFLSLLKMLQGANPAWQGDNAWILPFQRIASDGERWLFLINAGASRESLHWHYGNSPEISLELPPMSAAIYRETERLL